MRPANLESLKEKIIRPDFDKHLVPLMLYRGPNNMASFGKIQRVWNLAVTLMESEVENYTDAVKLGNNPDYAHLCGPRKPMIYGNFASAFGRMVDNPKVTDNIPGLTDYCRSIRGPKWKLTPVDIYTNDVGVRHNVKVAPWRIIGYSPEEMTRRATIRSYRKANAEERKLRAEIEKKRRRDEILSGASSGKLFYPYVIHKPSDNNGELSLMMEVNKAVPAHLPDWLRADICQDLIVAVLSGDITRDQIADGVKGYARKVFEMHPIKYGPFSLDASFSEDNENTLLDILQPDPLEDMMG